MTTWGCASLKCKNEVNALNKYFAVVYLHQTITVTYSTPLLLCQSSLYRAFHSAIASTVVWKKFTVGYFRVKFVRGKIFSSLGVSNEQKTLLFILFIHCQKYFVCLSFVVSHQRRKFFSAKVFPNYGMCTVLVLQ